MTFSTHEPAAGGRTDFPSATDPVVALPPRRLFPATAPCVALPPHVPVGRRRRPTSSIHGVVHPGNCSCVALPSHIPVGRRQLLHALLYLPTSLWVAGAALPPRRSLQAPFYLLHPWSRPSLESYLPTSLDCLFLTQATSSIPGVVWVACSRLPLGEGGPKGQVRERPPVHGCNSWQRRGQAVSPCKD